MASYNHNLFYNNILKNLRLHTCLNFSGGGSFPNSRKSASVKFAVCTSVPAAIKTLFRKYSTTVMELNQLKNSKIDLRIVNWNFHAKLCISSFHKSCDHTGQTDTPMDMAQLT